MKRRKILLVVLAILIVSFVVILSPTPAEAQVTCPAGTYYQVDPGSPQGFYCVVGEPPAITSAQEWEWVPSYGNGYDPKKLPLLGLFDKMVGDPIGALSRIQPGQPIEEWPQYQKDAIGGAIADTVTIGIFSWVDWLSGLLAEDSDSPPTSAPAPPDPEPTVAPSVSSTTAGSPCGYQWKRRGDLVCSAWCLALDGQRTWALDEGGFAKCAN